MTASPSHRAIAVILAGGKGRRLGGVAKATVDLNGVTLLDRVRAALAPQAATILLSLAGDQVDAPWAEAAGLPVIGDPIAEAGPMGGVAGALVWARAYAPKTKAVISVPVDVPFVPADLVTRLLREDGVAAAESGGQVHHAVAAWPLSVADDLLASVARGDVALHRWQARHPLRRVSWPVADHDPFLNINTPEDLAAARAIAARIAAQQPRSTA